MKTNKNDATFPLSDDSYYFKQPGLTKLEYFAAAALQGILAGLKGQFNFSSEEVAVAARLCAEKLIEELNGVSDETK